VANYDKSHHCRYIEKVNCLSNSVNSTTHDVAEENLSTPSCTVIMTMLPCQLSLSSSQKLHINVFTVSQCSSLPSQKQITRWNFFC